MKTQKIAFVAADTDEAQAARQRLMARYPSTDPENADVKWTLLMNGAPVLPDQSGNAIQQDGTWKVSATTFCTLLAIQGGGAPVPGC